jgi:iron complex outermembrane receptor protein
VFLWVQNLFDAHTVNTLDLTTATALGTPYVRLDPPRFFGAQFGYHF